MTREMHDLAQFYSKGVEPFVKEMFPGGFLNFGYWKRVSLSAESDTKERINTAQKELYRRTLDELRITQDDVLLEVGCGRGCGTALALQEYTPSEAHGVDAVERQVEKSKEINSKAIVESGGRLVYQTGFADSLPYDDNYFSKIISVEATPHFPNMDLFVEEIRRVSKPRARIAIASIFSPMRGVTSEQWSDTLAGDEVPSSIIHVHAMSDLVESFSKAGAKEIGVESIGEYVWAGFYNYLSVFDKFEKPRRRRYMTAYRDNLIDYYIVTATIS